jgi:hypothetical protein
MLLGAALAFVGSAVLYYAVTGKDPRKILSDTGAISITAKPKPANTAPAASIGQQR